MKTIIIVLVATFATFTSFAQKDKGKTSFAKEKAARQTKYTCAMHPDVVSDKPGKCPKCNMDLTLSKKEQMKMEVMKLYTCSMHPDVASNKPGKCPQCGMELTKVKK